MEKLLKGERPIMNEINYRPIQVSDYDGLQALLQNEWYSHYVAKDREITQAFVQLDLHNCLMKSSFGYVAVMDDEIVGVILGRIQANAPKLAMFTQDITANILTLITEESPIVAELAQIFQNRHSANQAMKHKITSHYEAEAVLFIVSAANRGKGIGSGLWQLIQEEFKQQHIERYCLFTDKWCNYGFYDYKGLQRIESYTVNENASEPTHFLYEGEVH